MNKKLKKILIILLSAVLFAGVLVLPSCVDKALKVSKIEVVTGTLKAEFALDEMIDFNLAKIKVTFTNGTSQIINITQDMIADFDSSTTKENATMTITYESKSTTFIYNVTNSVPIQTAFRVKLTKKAEESRVVTVEVKATGLESTGPIYAIKLTVQCSKDTTLNNISSPLQGFSIVEEKKSKNEIDIVLYSSDGISSVDKDSTILQITATKAAKTGTLYIQSISVSDGEKDFAVPAAIPLNADG